MVKSLSNPTIESTQRPSLNKSITRIAKDRKHSCKKCKKTFITKYKLQRHHLEVHNSKQASFDCDKCGKSYKRKEHLRRHYQKIHNGQRFQCAYCEKSYVEKSHLRNHFMRSHRVLVCPHCNHYYQQGDMVDERRTCCFEASNLSNLQKGSEASSKKANKKNKTWKYPFLYECQSCSTCFFTHKEEQNHKCTHRVSSIPSSETKVIDSVSSPVPLVSKSIVHDFDYFDMLEEEPSTFAEVEEEIVVERRENCSFTGISILKSMDDLERDLFSGLRGEQSPESRSIDDIFG